MYIETRGESANCAAPAALPCRVARATCFGAGITLAMLIATTGALHGQTNGALEAEATHLVQVRVPAVAAVLSSSAPVVASHRGTVGTAAHAVAEIRIASNVPCELHLSIADPDAAAPGGLWVAIRGQVATRLLHGQTVVLPGRLAPGVRAYLLDIRAGGRTMTGSDLASLRLHYEIVPVDASGAPVITDR